MKVSFDTKNIEEVEEVIALLNLMAHSVTETVPQDTKDVSETQSSPEPKKTVKAKPTQKAKPEVVPEKEEPKSSITISTLKDSAKEAVLRVDRAKVKEIISEFAEKLTEVKEADYGKLYKKLQELGK
jgi:hypothetical protein